MKCSECGVVNETVKERRAGKSTKNTDKRIGKQIVEVRLNKHMCDQCWAKWDEKGSS